MAHYPRSARNPARVTMRALAEMAGVSVQSVSLALRNQPSIGVETRTRIQALARQLGYTPDPQIVKLMHHLRTGHQHKLGASVCFLTTRPPTARETFCDLLLAGAIEGARTAGFSHHVIHVEPEKMPRDRLMRMLRARGVEGLLLLPMADLRPLDDLLNWREFSVISATLSVPSPKFDRVVVDHFQNVFGLIERLQEAGYRRPGLVVQREHDRRCGYHPAAALAWHGVYGAVEPVLAHRCEQLEPLAFHRWLEAQRPDVLLVSHDEFALELRQLPGFPSQLPVISCSARPVEDGTFPFSGNFDNPQQIGSVAAETLARKIALGIRGLPVNPHTTLIRGTWVGRLESATKRLPQSALSRTSPQDKAG